MVGRTPKKVVVSKAAITKAVSHSTKAPAKLAGRVVPAGYRRSAAVEAFLAKRNPTRP